MAFYTVEFGLAIFFIFLYKCDCYKLDISKSALIYNGSSRVAIRCPINNYGFSQFHFNKFVRLCLNSCCNKDSCEFIAFNKSSCLLVDEGTSYSFSEENFHFIFKDDTFRNINRQKRELDKAANPLKYKPKMCEVLVDDCGENAICISLGNKSRNGVCLCQDGYSWSNNTCHMNIESNTSLTTDNVTVSTVKPMEDSKSASLIPPTSASMAEPKPPEKLVVSVHNKTFVLPEGSDIYKDTATLSAYAIGEESAPTYSYKWTLLEKPENEHVGSYSDMNSQTISLTNLVAGTYSFKVEVEGDNAYGETVGNIIVLPTSHINSPPVAIVEPSKKIFKLPISVIILDASSSHDDKGIVSYQWEIISSPIGYKVANEDNKGKSLQLTNLVPGNYSIMLKVKDEAGLMGNTTAFITIIKETDYPPTPNAGGDKIIYLPQTEVILNGNSSTDDHEIVEWEWISGPENSGKAVDMQDSRTAYLKLSNLEEGHYHFILKVTDSSDQSTNSSAQVYVHSSADNFPQAKAGKNMTVLIPNTTATLDGSLSEQVLQQTIVRWTQVTGPNVAKILNPDALKTNVSGLTKGVYTFNLSLWNSNNEDKISFSNTSIIVLQEKNDPPKAHAGGDFSIILPVSVVLVNGTSSSDDVGISKWLWVRDSSSLAAGKIIKNSDKSAILLFTGVVPGRYIWNLTVWDDQGLSSTDTVSIIVKDGPHHLNEVEIVIGVGVETFSISQRENLLQKLELLLHSTNSKINLVVQSIHGIPLSGRVSLIVFGQIDDVDVPGMVLVEQLRTKTHSATHSFILDVPIINIDTVVCQNNCSDHGDCIQSSRECLCHSWWMESSFRRRFGDRNQNCDWSVVYVFIGAIGSSMLLCIFLWGMALGLLRCIRKNRIIRCKTAKYELLDGDGAKSHIPPSLFESDTDTCSETEVLFESKKSAQQRAKRNGHVRLQRLKKL